MARNIHILFGFDENPVSKQIITGLKTKGYAPEVAYRATKASIQDYVSRYSTCDTLVIREVMEGEEFSATELAALNDSRMHNVIVLVDEDHRGTSFMQVLYSAGITSAIFVSGTSGAGCADILNLIFHPRNNKRARNYYGMTSMKAQVNLLTSDSYVQNYNYLIDETKGVNIIDRYVCIVNKLPVDQAVSFTRQLPSATLKRIMQYEEFYRVMAMFGKRGYKLKYKKPRNLKRGMTDEAFDAYIKGKTPAMMNASVKRTTPKPPQKPVKRPSPVKKQKPTPAPAKKKAVKTKSVKSENAFFEETEKRHKKERAKQRINWKLILGILIAGILLLVIMYFGLSYALLR